MIFSLPADSWSMHHLPKLEPDLISIGLRGYRTAHLFDTTAMTMTFSIVEGATQRDPTRPVVAFLRRSGEVSFGCKDISMAQGFCMAIDRNSFSSSGYKLRRVLVMFD